MKSKKCSKCKKELPLSEFGKDRRTKSGWLGTCKKCRAAVQRKYYQTKNGKEHQRKYRRTRSAKPNYAAGQRKRHVEKLYGITVEDYDRMLEDQGGVCAICHKTETVRHNNGGCVRRLAIDHCHETGEVRGLLCARCNSMLGQACNNVTTLLEAAIYLERATQ